MAGAERPRSVGELVRVADGESWPITLPITLIGSGGQCDVQIDGAELHCALTLTPAGLALRSWNPEATTLAGRPTAAGLLADGQELRLGDDLYRLTWNFPSEPERAPIDHLDQVQIAREQFRLERAKVEAKLAEREKRIRKDEAGIREDEREVAAEKNRVRALYERCLQRIRQKWTAERSSFEANRREFEVAEERFREFSTRKRAEIVALDEKFAADRTRLKTAWDLLADGQRRAIADRQRSEEWLARQRDTLELRSKMLTEQVKLFETHRSTFDGRQPQLIAEIAGLEARATHLRQAIAALEAKREKLYESNAERGDSIARTAVALEAPRLPRGTAIQVDSLLGELQAREQELTRERQSLGQARAELQRQASDLADERAILAEQIAALAAARDLWHTAEERTVEELQTLALGVRHGEQSLDGRERELLAAERRRRHEDHALVELRFKLENWQAALLARESSLQTEAEKLEANLSAKRDEMDRQESALEFTASAWCALRQQELEFYRAELDRLAAARSEHRAAIAELQHAREEQAELVRNVAARDLAVAGETNSAGSSRRVRVLERRWKSHFRKEETRLKRAEQKLAADKVDLDDRLHRLHDETERFLERQAAETAERTAHELEQHAAVRRLAEAQGDADLEAELRFRTEADARRLRGELARMAQAIQTANLSHPDEADVLPFPLQVAQVA